MLTQIRSKRLNLAMLVVLIAGVAFAALASPRPASAHCDSESGPVATAARQALEKGNVKLVLAYVPAQSEVELQAAFEQARSVRKAGGEAKALADRYFVETAVRLHREGEGAAYEGVTNEATPRAILIADKAMASGSLDETYKLLDAAMQTGLQEKYEAVVKARAEAKELGTVEAERERAEAELIFEKYVYELWTLASAVQPHAEGHTH